MMKRRLMVALVLILLALSALPAGAQGSASVTITPDTALEDGDLVTVAGSGFTPASDIFLLLCNSDTRLGDTLGRCALIGNGATGYTVGPSGSFKVTDIAVPVGQVGATGLATCPPSAAQLARGISCAVQVSNADLVEVASATITYVDQPTGPNELAFTGPAAGWLVWLATALVALGFTVNTGGRIWERRRA